MAKLCPRRVACPWRTHVDVVARSADAGNVPEVFRKQFLCLGHKIGVHRNCYARDKTSQHLGTQLYARSRHVSRPLLRTKLESFTKFYDRFIDLCGKEEKVFCDSERESDKVVGAKQIRKGGQATRMGHSPALLSRSHTIQTPGHRWLNCNRQCRIILSSPPGANLPY